MTENQKKTIGVAVVSLVCGLFFFIPLLGFVLGIVAVALGIIALVRISKNKDNLKGEGLAIAGIVLGTIGVLFGALIILLAAIAIPNLMRARISANNALAKSTLRTIATASETYASVNQGQYPLSENDLMATEPPYISHSCCGQEISGFVYSCQFDQGGYAISASPISLGESGTTTFTIMTGGILTPE